MHLTYRDSTPHTSTVSGASSPEAGAPVEFYASEVLKGLIGGLELVRIGHDWALVFTGQTDVSRSSVSPDIFDYLLERSFIERGSVSAGIGKATITDLGRAAFAGDQRRALKAAMEWASTLELPAIIYSG
jgi:hypothetical protein